MTKTKENSVRFLDCSFHPHPLSDQSWKENLSQKFSISYVPSKTINWTQLIYGDASNPSSDLKDDEDVDEVGGLFHVAQRKKVDPNEQEDYTWQRSDRQQNWDLEEISSLIRDCFVTGKWEKGKDAAQLLAEDDEIDDDDADDDGELFGDFEDLETGETMKEEEEEKGKIFLSIRLKTNVDLFD